MDTYYRALNDIYAKVVRCHTGGILAACFSYIQYTPYLGAEIQLCTQINDNNAMSRV
jgi:hypothetical protein